MKNKSLKKFLICLCLFSMVFGATAYAATAKTTTKYSSVYGYNYYYFASLNKNNNSVFASGEVGDSTSSKRIPVGYMGVDARLYTVSGGLVANTGMRYNDVNSSLMGRSTQRVYGTNTYYASALVNLYNGNGYSQVGTGVTPRLNLPRSTQSYSINKYGETYGSAMYAQILNEEPDLILAVGTNGETGYVRSSDLNPEFTSPETAAEYTESLPQTYTIPLYKSDGKTIIGSYLVGCEN